MIHEPSGARGEARDERSQRQNKQAAFKRMANTNEFRSWVRKQAGEGAHMISKVERELWPDRIVVETKNQLGEWTQVR